YGLTKPHKGSKRAEIDADVLYALLTVDRYRHGARSIEAILQMCTRIHNKIEKSSLPSRAQLNMHVNADEFFIRMYRGRYRAKTYQEELRPRRPEPEAAKKLETEGEAPAEGGNAEKLRKYSEKEKKPEAEKKAKDESQQ